MWQALSYREGTSLSHTLRPGRATTPDCLVGGRDGLVSDVSEAADR